MRIAVLGARGQLGAAIVDECSGRHDVAAFDRQALDINDQDAVERAVQKHHSDAIINCAAYNAVDAAEDHQVEALRTNAFAVRGLARIARERNLTLVHFSSDFVFDGTANSLYTEEARPNPRSVYATSKMLGDWFAADAPKAYVLRVESLFGRTPQGPPLKGTVAQIIKTIRSGQVARVLEDRTVSPTYVRDAARATREILERSLAPGLYHCVNSGSCTWLEFAREAARAMGIANPPLDVVKFKDVTLAAARPQFCALSNAKLVGAGIFMPTWKAALRSFLANDLPHEVAHGEAGRQSG